jgi:fatty acid desaturase
MPGCLYNYIRNEAMEDNTKLFESLLERAAEYGKTSYELVKLKAVDKSSDVVSSFIPNSIVFVLIASFMLFLNLGLAFWFGEILGRTYLGFFVVAGFYVFTGIVFHFLMHKWIKNKVRNYIIKLLLK